MTKTTSSDKIMFRVIIGIFVSLGLMEVVFHFLGELQGLITLVIALIVHISFLTGRVFALERRLQDSEESSSNGPAKLSDKTV